MNGSHTATVDPAPNGPDAAQLLAILESVTDAVFTVDPQWRFTYLNHSASLTLGPREDLLGQSVWDVFPELRGSAFQTGYEEAFRTGRRVRVEAFAPSFDAWYEADAYPGDGQLTVFFRACSDRRRAEAAEVLEVEIRRVVEQVDGHVDAMVQAGGLLRAETGYDAAMVWLSDHDGVAHLVGSHAAPGADHQLLHRVGEDLRATAGVGVDGPVRVDDLADVLRDGADTSDVNVGGLRAALFLPIDWGDGTTTTIGLLTSTGPGHDDWIEVLSLLHPRLVELGRELRSRHELRQLFDVARDPMCVLGHDGWLRRANPAYCELLGYPEEELLARPYASRVHVDDLERTHREVARLVEGGEETLFENRVRIADGSFRTLSWRARGVAEERLVYATARDVTEDHRRRQLDEDRRGVLQAIALDQPLEMILDELMRHIGRWVPGCRAAVVLLDPQTRTLLPASRGTMPAKFLDAVYPLGIGPEAGSCGTAAHTRQTVVIPDVFTDPRTAPYRTLNEAVGVHACWSVPIMSPRGDVVGVLTAYPDRPSSPDPEELTLLDDAAGLAGLAIAHDRTRAALHESLQRFRLLGDALTEIIWDWDLVVGDRWFNDRAIEVFQWPPREARPQLDVWRDSLHPDDREDVLDSLDAAWRGEDELWSREYRLVRGDGTETTILGRGRILRDATGRAIRMVGGMWDLSAPRPFDERLLRGQRLESLGSLAGGIAHDLNNVFAPIVMSAGLLGMAELDDRNRELVDLIERTAERGSRMVRQVLTFARGAEEERSRLQVDAVVDDVMGMLRDSFLKQVDVEVDVAPGLPPVLADATLLHQVLVNICVNARDAMPQGGRLTVSADHVWLDRPMSVASGQADAGSYVRISVTDTGSGIAPKDLPRLFEPFFTTKGPDEGTGLGLATSLNIVRSHGGFIDVDSTLGEGTAFHVHLPVEHDAGSTEVQRPVDTSNDAPPRSILVVDDDRDVLTSCRHVLQSEGRTVLTATDGAEALVIASRRAGQLDLVLTDLMMPVMDGITMLRSIRRIAPELPVVVMTGLDATARTAEAMAAGATGVLHKPYSADALIRVVTQALGDA